MPVNITSGRITLKQLQDQMITDAMPLWAEFMEIHRCEPSREQTAAMLQTAYPEKYARHKASSIVRHLSLEGLNRGFSNFRNEKEKEGKRILS